MSWISPHGTPLPDWRRRTLVMGIMNVTPDSFSDGGQLPDPDAVLRRAESLLAAGADVLDLGAESTRPGATPVSAQEESARLIPAIKALRRAFPQAALSVDTYKAAVAEAGIEAGADLVNDVEGARFEAAGEASPLAVRSEEHTSELQSLPTISYAVFCLRSEERRVGKECYQPCRSRWSPYH